MSPLPVLGHRIAQLQRLICFDISALFAKDRLSIIRAPAKAPISPRACTHKTDRMSALRPKADIHCGKRIVRFVPGTDKQRIRHLLSAQAD
jgi:hypothetical protein